MPVKPSWCRDLPAGIARLESLESEWVGRRDVELALDVSKTVAWRLLRQCGGQPGPGNGLACRRSDLIARLRHLATDGDASFEVRRRERLASYLARIRPEVVANRTRVVPDSRALALLSTKFASLPPNVTLTPTNLTIEFRGTEEFLAAVGSVVYALNNDFEAIVTFLDGA